ncbi:hypothetical protein [Micromonospora sp. KC213]|uniref:hypothetical protein n=1 Tax=Micromonospora sp. KC213 TaxID=2530378 RepID=UPI001053316B|nr:hypothetical protein [Micromonospora sp. KC213]TDC33229.1 hypothetical protein E1166_25910 [Micromonospora sp. KC213]
MTSFGVIAGFALLVYAAPLVTPPRSAAVTLTIAQAPVGELTITVPAVVSLGGGPPGGTISQQMGAVTVRDTRSASPNTWAVTVTATAFTTGAGTPAQTIPTTRVSYWSGPATRASGGGSLAPGQPTSAQAQTLTAPRTAFRKISGNAPNRVSWQPTLVISIPSGAATGLYSGRVTHSVS